MDIKTTVIFRWWQGDVIAIFPEEPADYTGHNCQSYQHVGQHGGCDLQLIISQSRPATPEEYADLKAELETIGYSLRVRQRRSPIWSNRAKQGAMMED